MKKFLVLALVLGIASMAPAALNIVINGDIDPLDSEITLLPSETLILGVEGATAAGGAANAMYVVVGPGTVDNSGATYQGGLSGNFYQLYVDYYWAPSVDRAGLPAVAGYASDLGALSGILIDNIVFHCEGPGDVVVELYESVDSGATWQLTDTAIVHQIPEPATMALLGLGALVLRRKK